jgi:hypothetical protein
VGLEALGQPVGLIHGHGSSPVTSRRRGPSSQ